MDFLIRRIISPSMNAVDMHELSGPKLIERVALTSRVEIADFSELFTATDVTDKHNAI